MKRSCLRRRALQVLAASMAAVLVFGMMPACVFAVDKTSSSAADPRQVQNYGTNGAAVTKGLRSSSDDVEIRTDEISYKSGTYDSAVVEQDALFSHTDPTSEIDFDKDNLKTPDDAMPLSCDPAVYEAFGFDSDELTDSIGRIQNDESYKDTMAGFSYIDPNEFVVASDNHVNNHENIIRVNDNVKTGDVSTLPDNIGIWDTHSNTQTMWDESKNYQTHNVTGADLNGDGIDEVMVFLSLRAGSGDGDLDIDVLTKYTDDGTRWLWETAENTEDSRYTEHLPENDEILDIKASEAKGYTAITAGDFDGDGNEEIAFYVPSREKDEKGIRAKVKILKVTADKHIERGYTFRKVADIYLRDIAPDTAQMDKDWHLPVVSLQTTRTRLNGKDGHNSKSITHYNVYEDLVINISAPNINSYDDLNNDSFTAIYGRKTSGGAIEQLWKTEHEPFQVNGDYYRMSAVNSCDADLNGDGFDEIVVAGVSEAATGDDLKGAGSYDEDTNFVNVISNTKGSYELTWTGYKAVEAAEHLDPNNFGSLEPAALCAGHFDGSTGQSFDQVCIEGVIFAADGTKVTGTPSYAENDTQGTCTYAVISDTDSDNNAENLAESDVTFRKVYAFDISKSSNPKHHPWIDTAVSGHFCSESDVDSIALISNDTGAGLDHIYMDITMISYYQSPDAAQGGQFKHVTHDDYIDRGDEDDNGTSLAICFINHETDSYHYRYRGTYAAYTAPKLYTVVQAQPYYEEVNDADTKFTISTGVGFNVDAKIGLLLQASISVPSGIPGVRVGMDGELNFAYGVMSGKTKTVTRTFQFYSDQDYALVYTVPEVVNMYDLILDETGECIQYNMFQPLSPEFAALPVEDFDAAIDTPSSEEYLPVQASVSPVTRDMLPESAAGDPLAYPHSLKDIIGKDKIDPADMTTIEVESAINSTAEQVENTLEYEDDYQGSVGVESEVTLHIRCCSVTDIGVGVRGDVTCGRLTESGTSYTLYYRGIPKELEYGITFDPRSSVYSDLTKILHYDPVNQNYCYNSTAVAYRLVDRVKDYGDENVTVLSFYTTNVKRVPEQPDQFQRKSLRKNNDGSVDISLSWISQTKNEDRVPDGYNLYMADTNPNLSTVHLLNTESLIPKSSSKYTTYDVHLDAGNYSDKCTFYLVPVFLEDDDTKNQVTEGAIDRRLDFNISTKTNVIITEQPHTAYLRDDGTDQIRDFECSARKADDVFLGTEKMWFYWMMQDKTGKWNILQVDSFDVTGVDDVSENTSMLALTVPGEYQDDYVEMPIICRIAYGNSSVTSDGVILKYEEPVLKAVSLKTVKRAGRGKIQVNWKKNPKADGYQVGFKKKGTGSFKTIKIKGRKRTSFKISKLKKSRKYIVRIRAYKKYRGKTIYSPWSKKKTVKVK